MIIPEKKKEKEMPEPADFETGKLLKINISNP